MSIFSALLKPSRDAALRTAEGPAERVIVTTGTTEAEEPTTQIVKEILDETKQLVKVEVQLAKDELVDQALSMQKAAIGFGVAAGAVVYAIGMLLVALVLAFGAGPVPALIVAGILLAVAAAGGLAGWHFVPKKPMDHTRQRLETSVKLFKERIA